MKVRLKKLIYEKGKQLPVILDCDVLVCGGDDFGALAQILTDLVGGGTDILFVF